MSLKVWGRALTKARPRRIFALPRAMRAHSLAPWLLLPAAPLKLETLKKRSDFLRLRGGARWSGASCVMECKPAAAGRTDDAPPRFGFTITKKLGNAVLRNRIRRRLKAALTQLAPLNARTGYDYVLVARTAAATRPFADLVKELEQAFQRVHHPASQKKSERPPKR